MGLGHHHLPPEQLPFLLSAQPVPKDAGETSRMELGPTTETFVLDGGPGPDTLSGEG